MSVSRNFRVNVNLSNFFNDHRHTVRLFVNDDIETIKDLKKKIGNIFGLRDFYLVCQNEYLPPSEDVRILQKDELLWAMADKSEKCVEHNMVLDTGAITIKPCKTTKRPLSPLEECVEEESSRPKKKKKKHSKEKEVLNIKKLLPVLHSHINSYNERNGNTSKIDRKIDNDNEKEVVCKGNLQNYKKKVPLPTITEDYLKKKRSNIVKINMVLGSPKSDNKDNNCNVTESVIEKSARNGNMISTETLHSDTVTEAIVNKECDLQEKYTQSDVAERLQEKSVTTPESQNIVAPNRRSFFFSPPSRSKIVPKFEIQECIDKSSHSILENTTHIPQVEQVAIIEDKKMENISDQNKINLEVDESKVSNVSAQIDNNTISPIVPKSSVEVSEETKLNITNNDWDTFSTEISVDKSSSQLSGFHKLNSSTSDKSKFKELSGIGHLLGDLRSSDSGSYETIADSSVEFVQTKRRRHRKRASKKTSSYGDDSVIMIEPSTSKPIKAKANPTIHLKFVEDEQSDDVVAVDVKNRRDESKSQPMSDIEMSTVDDSVENFEIREKNVKEYPLMDGLLPKIGDVVIFKKLKLTDDYCPIVSSWIAGRVQAFDTVTKIVTLDIVVGLDQCEEPKGKLSIDTDNNQPKQSTMRDILWEGVIEPRLIYP